MIQFRVYLKSELGKLGNGGDASWFLSKVPYASVLRFGMPATASALIERFATQDKVNSFVDSLSDAELDSLTKTCDHEWRKNGVFDRLHRGSSWEVRNVHVDKIDVQQAEAELGLLFEQHQFQLKRIARDAELWRHEPYSKWDRGRPVAFPVTLARNKAGRLRLFDGIHRAIGLADAGHEIIQVCFSEG